MWLILLSACVLWIGWAAHAAAGILAGVIILSIASLLPLLGWRLGKAAFVAERVTPITRRNTGDIPEVESLVRPSDLPPSHQQAELLRAAKPGQETPPEELLRAAIFHQKTP